MNFTERYKLYGFYQNELKSNLLGFWLPRCEDKEYGGFLNCFDNSGERLVSYDKYAWSQGRLSGCLHGLRGRRLLYFLRRREKNSCGWRKTVWTF